MRDRNVWCGLFLLFIACDASAQWIAVREDTVAPARLAAYPKSAGAYALSNLHVLTLANVRTLADVGGNQWPEGLESRKTSIWRLRDDLSYEPAQPRITRDEERFAHFDVYGYIPGRNSEVEALTREYVAADRAAGVKHRWTVYEVIAADDLPAYVVVTYGRNRRDFEEEKVAADSLRAGRDIPLHVRNTPLLRRVDSFEGSLVSAGKSTAASPRTDSTKE